MIDLQEKINTYFDELSLYAFYSIGSVIYSTIISSVQSVVYFHVSSVVWFLLEPAVYSIENDFIKNLKENL